MVGLSLLVFVAFATAVGAFDPIESRPSYLDLSYHNQQRALSVVKQISSKLDITIDDVDVLNNNNFDISEVEKYELLERRSSGLNSIRRMRSGPTEGKIVKLGTTTAVTGYEVPYSTEQNSYIVWAVNYINNIYNGGNGFTIGTETGYKIQLTVYDDASDCTLISILTQWLITVDKVDMLLTGVTTGCNATSFWAEYYQVPCINNGNYGYFFTYPDGLNWTAVSSTNPQFSAAPCVQQYCKAGAKSAVVAATPSQYPSFNYSLLYAVQTYCPDMELLFFDNLDETELNGTGSLEYLTPYIEKWKKADADCLFGGAGPGTEGYNFFYAIRYLQYNFDGYSGWSDLNFPDTRTLLGALAYGGTSYSTFDTSFNFTDPIFGNTATFNAAYQAAFDGPASSYAVDNVVAVVFAVKAIINAGSLDKYALRDALFNFNESTIQGVLSFTPEGFTTALTYCFQFQGDNKYGVISDPSFGFGNLVYPWDWVLPAGFKVQPKPQTWFHENRVKLLVPLILVIFAIVVASVVGYILYTKYHLIVIPDRKGKGGDGTDW